MEAIGVTVVEHDNLTINPNASQHSSLHRPTAVAPIPPSLRLGDPLHYETMIQRICNAYTQRPSKRRSGRRVIGGRSRPLTVSQIEGRSTDQGGGKGEGQLRRVASYHIKRSGFVRSSSSINHAVCAKSERAVRLMFTLLDGGPKLRVS
jgi:hypothetical protein